MPLKSGHDKEGNLKQIYDYTVSDIRDSAWLLAKRSEIIKHHELMLVAQKYCQDKKDYAWAKYFSVEVKDALKMRKAMTYVTGLFLANDEKPGDSRDTQCVSEWPTELCYEFDYILGGWEYEL